LIYNLNFNL